MAIFIHSDDLCKKKRQKSLSKKTNFTLKNVRNFNEPVNQKQGGDLKLFNAFKRN